MLVNKSKDIGFSCKFGVNKNLYNQKDKSNNMTAVSIAKSQLLFCSDEEDIYIFNI